MIKLPHNLYAGFEDEYFQIIKKKINHGKSLFRHISTLSKQNPNYKIVKDQQEEFLRCLIINPFGKSSFPILEDYYRYAQGKKADPFASISKRSLPNIFKYTSIIQSVENSKELRVRVIEHSGIEVCPYCNRQYVDVFKKIRKEYKAIAQLDHHYPKETFPLYGLTLYNFVPSCASCNQGKSTSYKEVIYPFSKTADIENEQPYFKTKPKNLDDLLGKTLPDIEYAFNDQIKTDHANFFHHKNMYANHRSFAQQLLRAQRLDNEGYRQGINEIFKKAKIHLEPNDLKELLYGFNGSDEELLQKPLSKLARDLIPSLKK